MSTEAHTPGPWHDRRMACDLSWSSLGFIQVGGKDLIATVTVRDLDEGKANARLIAAAPDMRESLDPDTLEAIADEIDCFEHSARAGSLRSIAKRQRAAIAKAESQS